MFGCRSAWRRVGTQLFSGLAVPGLLAVTADFLKLEPAVPPGPVPALVSPHLPAGVAALDLAGCKALALARQPAIAAARVSLDAAVARQQALDTIRVPGFLAPDLPTRKQQAAVGLGIAQAEVQRVQLDTLYAVTYAFLTGQYATEQRKLVDEGLESLGRLEEGVKAGLRAGKTNIRKEDLTRIQSYRALARSRREEAVQGERRALSALREAIGLDNHVPLLLSPCGQFRLCPAVSKEFVLAAALSRRPEIVQASLLAQVHELEVGAQAAHKLRPQVPTFASGSDLHARPLPAGSYDERYSPAAVGPEMPANLAGDRDSRVHVAKLYTQRAAIVADKTRNLIRLEAEQAFLRYLEASRRLPALIEAADKAQAVFEAVRTSFDKGERATTVRDYLSAGSLTSELRSQVNTTRYQMLVALAGIERATGGAFHAGFENAPTSDPGKPTDKEPEEKKDRDDSDKDDS